MQANRGGGLFDALKSFGATLLESGKTRLELLANEIEEGKQRAVDLILMALAMAFCLGMATLLAIFFLTVLFWDNRLFFLGASTALFLVLAGFFYGRFKRLLQGPEQIFSASISELQNDIRQLKAAVGHESPPVE